MFKIDNSSESQLGLIFPCSTFKFTNEDHRSDNVERGRSVQSTLRVYRSIYN